MFIFILFFPFLSLSITSQPIHQAATNTTDTFQQGTPAPHTAAGTDTTANTQQHHTQPIHHHQPTQQQGRHQAGMTPPSSPSSGTASRNNQGSPSTPQTPPLFPF